MNQKFIDFSREYTRRKIAEYQQNEKFKYFYAAVLPVSERTVDGFLVEITEYNRDQIDWWIRKHGYEGYPIGRKDSYGKCKIVVFHPQAEADLTRNAICEAWLSLAELRGCLAMPREDISADVVGVILSPEERLARSRCRYTGYKINVDVCVEL